MESILGIALSNSIGGLVVVDRDPTGDKTLDRDVVLRNGDATTFFRRVADAALRMQTHAASSGRPLCAIQVTFDKDTVTSARRLLVTLAEAALENVATLRFPPVVETMARHIGCADMAVCVLEPDSATVLHGRLRSATSDSLEPDHLARWVVETLDGHGRPPRALVTVGSCSGLHAITDRLREALPVPVVTPIQTQLALARAAAVMPSPSDPQVAGKAAPLAGVSDGKHRGSARRTPLRPKPLVATLAMLAAVSAGAVLLVLTSRGEPERMAPSDVTITAPATTAEPRSIPAVPSPISRPPTPMPVQETTPPAIIDVPPRRAADEPRTRPHTEVPAPAPAPNEQPNPAQAPPRDGPPVPPDNCVLTCGVAL